jgi:O-antigen/teichoic acid export membrane protein
MKNYLKLSLWNYFGYGVSLLLSLIRVKLLTSIFSVYEYGSLNQIITSASFVIFLTSLNFGNSMVRLSSGVEEKERIDFLFTANITQIFFQLIVIFLCFPLKGKIILFLTGNNDAPNLFLFISLYILLMNIKGQLLNYIVCQGNYIRRVISEIAVAALELLLIAVIVYKFRTIDSLIISFSLSIVIFYVVYSIIYKFWFFKGRFVKEKLMSMLRFGLPLLGSSIAISIIPVSNSYIINYFRGLSDVALYNVATRLPTMIEMIYTCLCLVLLSRLSVLYDSNNFERVNYWINLLMRLYLFLSLIAGIIFTINGSALIRLLTNENYIFPSLPFLLSLFIVKSILYGAFLIYGKLLELVKFTKWLGICWFIIMIVNFILGVIFIPKMGILGSAIASIISLLAGILIGIKKKVNFVIWDVPFVRYLLLFVLLLTISYLLASRGENILINIVCTVSLIIMATICSMTIKLIRKVDFKNE